MIRGRVARILSKRQLALNVGSDHGVEKGMRFAIFAPSDTITDPESGEILGSYRHRKAAVQVTTVADKYCFVGPVPQNKLLTELLGGLESPEQMQSSPGLPVDKSQIDPFPSGTAIGVGDEAKQIPGYPAKQ